MRPAWRRDRILRVSISDASQQFVSNLVLGSWPRGCSGRMTRHKDLMSRLPTIRSEQWYVSSVGTQIYWLVC